MNFVKYKVKCVNKTWMIFNQIREYLAGLKKMPMRSFQLAK